jgi:glutamine--fructose-6-phosphate transaminase
MGVVIAIISQDDKEIAELVDDVIEVPVAGDILIPMLSVVPLQLFAYHMALTLGCDVDRPRNLAKAVTVE